MSNDTLSTTANADEACARRAVREQFEACGGRVTLNGLVDKIRWPQSFSHYQSDDSGCIFGDEEFRDSFVVNALLESEDGSPYAIPDGSITDRGATWRRYELMRAGEMAAFIIDLAHRNGRDFAIKLLDAMSLTCPGEAEEIRSLFTKAALAHQERFTKEWPAQLASYPEPVPSAE